MKIGMKKSAALVCAFMVAGAMFAFAQSELPGSGTASEDSLFADEVVVSSPVVDAGNGIAKVLKTASVRIGGSFTGSAGFTWRWNNPWTDGFNLVKPDSTAIIPVLSSLIYFDARPDEDFRVYGSVKTAWPFTSAASLPNISVFELFSDFSWKDSIFFRFGKSTVKWGTGYFWSPADVINVGHIDFTDPTAQREGPVNFRVHVPILGTQNNFYAYTILNPADPTKLLPSDVGFAAKAEVLIKHYEVGLGGYYQSGKPERGMLTFAGPLGDFDVFGELSLAHGSEKVFVTDITASPPPFHITETTYPDSFFVSGTAGLSYNNSKTNVSGLFQYYYNGEGYADADRKSLMTKGFTIMDSFPEPLKTAFGYHLAGLAGGSGRHYAGLSLNKSEFLDKNITVSLLSIANLSDLSGLVRPSITWKLFDRLSLQSDLTFIFGAKETEYGVLGQGNPVTFGVSAKLGTGAF